MNTCTVTFVALFLAHGLASFWIDRRAGRATQNLRTNHIDNAATSKYRRTLRLSKVLRDTQGLAWLGFFLLAWVLC